MDKEEEESAHSLSQIDETTLEGRVLDWIEDESTLICDLATLDATFELCNTGESHKRKNNVDSFLYSDFLATKEPSKARNSILSRKRDVLRETKRGSFLPSIDRNAMAVSIVLLLTFLFFYDADTHYPSVNHKDEYSITSDNFAGSYHITDHNQANHIHYITFSENYNLIFIYSQMSVRSRKWIKIINKMERMLRYDRRQFGIHTTRCFDNNDSCQRLFGLQAKTPAVMLYHKNRYYHYAGRLSIDHLWSWIERMMSPIEIVYDLEDYYQKYLKYDVTFTAYFPFVKHHRAFRVHPRYLSYERIAMERTTGTPDSHRTRFFVVLNQTLAEYLKVDVPGTILFQSLLGRYEYLEPRFKEREVASFVLHWDRASWRVPFMYKGIHHENRFKIQSNRYFTKITNGTTIILFTRHDGLYYPGNDDITAFREIALEYNDCDLRPDWQWRVPMKIYHPRRYTASMGELHSSRLLELIEDRRVYEETRRIETVRHCCSEINDNRSLLSLCSCCNREIGYVDEEWICDVDSCVRSNSSDIFESETCDLLDLSRDEILSECCKLVHDSQRTGRISHHEEERRRIQRHEVAFRGYLGLSIEDKRISRAGIDAPRNMTVWKHGCEIDNALRFIIVDTKRTPSLARRMGIDPKSTPRVVIVDAEEERVAIMDWQYSRQSLRLFISSFHSEDIDWSPIIDGNNPQHRRADTEADGSERKEGDGVVRLKELDYQGLVELTTKTSLDRDAVLILTGGVSHAASAVLNFQLYETMLELEEKKIPVDFYSFDITLYDLPFNFRMNRYPSVYFLPADRPLDSFEFPQGLQFTSSNLFFFALASLSDKVRWQAVLSRDQPSDSLIRHLRARIEESERILRRRRRLSRRFIIKGLPGRIRACRLLLSYLHERNEDEDFSRILIAMQDAMSPLK